MFTDLNVFQLAHAMATHAGRRQAVVSRNIANADTPGYQARDIETFESAFKAGQSAFAMSGTRDTHIGGSSSASRLWSEFTPQANSDPNGNTVAIEEEMFKAVEIKRQHDRALAIYRSSMNLMRTGLGRS